LKWVQTQLLLKNTTLRGSRRVNPWNAFLKAKMSEVNTSCEEGKHVHLTDYVAKNKDQLLETYKQLSPIEQQMFINQVKATQESQVLTVRADPKAVSNTIAAAFSNMDREGSICLIGWTALCAKTGLKGFYIAVRESVEDLSVPRMFFTGKAERFVKTVLDIEPHRLALKLESWAVSGLDLFAPMNRQHSLNKLVSNCQTLVQEELDYILTEKRVNRNVKMNYDNYEHQIVERHGVALVG
ncbi:hypothetical protein OG21DRAFT_1398348, partial [Imleria badia]